ncbi:MAG TPA: hypothetical protein VFB35_07065 [Gaiellaceae bacterium]|jgi:hypothetical protein|nr:hypothetical protein [Gaiellaceae bacterium]
MLRRRALYLGALLALGTAPPASAFAVEPGVASALHAGGVAAPSRAADRARSCQAGTKSARLIGDAAHRTAVVACEQPPKSSPITPGALAKATAAALAVLG